MQMGKIAFDSAGDFAQPAFPDQAQRKMIGFASGLNRDLE